MVGFDGSESVIIALIFTCFSSDITLSSLSVIIMLLLHLTKDTAP
jgi:hypothetical protein